MLKRGKQEKGYKAIITSIDLKKLDRSFIGRNYDWLLISDLPAYVDPCGENGEFHTFVYDGPIFRFPIAIEKGQILEIEGYLYQDIINNGL